jgi:hypothetical protein
MALFLKRAIKDGHFRRRCAVAVTTARPSAVRPECAASKLCIFEPR